MRKTKNTKWGSLSWRGLTLKRCIGRIDRILKEIMADLRIASCYFILTLLI